MLQGVSIDLLPGSKSALVGPSGGGKVEQHSLHFIAPKRIHSSVAWPADIGASSVACTREVLNQRAAVVDLGK